MEKHPLHLKTPELQKSPEVERAVERHERRHDDTLPNNPNERIDTYINRLENIFLNADERVKDRNIEMMKEQIYDQFIIKEDDVPEAYFDLQKQIARERGQAVVEIDNATRARMIDVIVEDQKSSLDSWIDYLSSEDATYPAWFKYFVFKNITGLSQFDKELGKFKKRTPHTTAPFPDIYREPLAQVCDVYEAVAEDNTKLKDPEVQATFARSFPKVYATKIQESLSASFESRESIEGEWVKYEQGDSEGATKLFESLEGKGTGWCTAGSSTAESQIQAGDFYVFYSHDNQGETTQPRLAIRMNGQNQIDEVRGVLAHQEVEPVMQETLDEKLNTFGTEAEKYQKKSADMKRLTTIEQASQNNQPLTKNDLRFLYELDGPIQSFGYQNDPRIALLRQERDRQADIETMCDCPPEYLATSQAELTPETQVLAKDTGDKISLVDFRTEENQAKLPQIIETINMLKDLGTEAKLDTNIEGGVVSIDITPELKHQLKTYQGAVAAYREADNSSLSYVLYQLADYPYLEPALDHLTTVILDHGKTTEAERNDLVEAMKTKGYRPLTLAELIALGVTNPALNKRDVNINTYAPEELGGHWQARCLYWDSYWRSLSVRDVSSDWGLHDRFVFVRN